MRRSYHGTAGGGGSIAATGGRKAKRALIEARLREHPDWSDRLIANKLGCDGKTVEAVRTELESTAEIPQFDRLLGDDGKWYRVKRKAESKSREPAPTPPP